MAGESLNDLTRSLTAEFPAYAFTTQQTTHGQSLVAERRPGEPGTLYVVITSDPNEMRRTLSTTAPMNRPGERRNDR